MLTVVRAQAAFDHGFSLALGDRHWDLMRRGDRVSRLALMCLIQRNILPPAGSGASFTDECTRIAREAMAEHRICMAGLVSEPGSYMELYFNWWVIFRDRDGQSAS